ncbi:sigma factor-like helix-turn-helix DNA-binding protein [Polyangium mundeleinium]|uniref:Sigma factor-like helix-turn-helix DNA-binding protein n=1 Tax=Polyangium mundeleinium TaxID=2995306 RepID=A0ABT5F069_9BACT|nr:sigma factor-like helix-turn-helix DNA-binding protein [Polyangium mundeleinium]MDC0746562.1 sigma factor-like helix-turn-helix DNA-binding protein [Polyangium mundeleinium]
MIDTAPCVAIVVPRGRARRSLTRRSAALRREPAPVLVAHEIEGRSMLEIARALGIRLKTAYARLQLARNRLALCALF